jgi:hypothetical protein
MMTLGEVRAELKKLGVRQVGAMSRADSASGRPSYTFMFTSDAKVVFPFGLKTAYFLTLDSKDDSTPVNSEKYKALIRAIRRDNGAAETDVTWLNK